MEALITFINKSQIYVILVLLILVIVLFILYIINLRLLNGLENKYRKFMRGVNNKNLEELIISNLDKMDEIKNQTEYMKSLYEKMENRLNICIQKTSIIRYKAFEDVGSDLSFSIAFLDNQNNGVILTGIYGRNESTTYAKPIEQGISRYDLSEEEKFVLENAMNKKLK